MLELATEEWRGQGQGLPGHVPSGVLCLQPCATCCMGSGWGCCRTLWTLRRSASSTPSPSCSTPPHPCSICRLPSSATSTPRPGGTTSGPGMPSSPRVSVTQGPLGGLVFIEQPHLTSVETFSCIQPPGIGVEWGHQGQEGFLHGICPSGAWDGAVGKHLEEMKGR